MTSIDDYNLTTVINKEDFKNTVIIKECPIVGRSLVAKRTLAPGDIVLVEAPLIKYDLQPTCRSNKSPYFSKPLWKSLVALVHQHDTESDFYPGVPAAILAYLDIHPPTHAYTNVRRRQTFESDDFDFFYYPSNTQDYPTIQLVHTVTHHVVDTEPLFAHVDPIDLCNFVLKIYSNAHTVSLPHTRSLPTHTHKKARRGKNTYTWEKDTPANTPTMALLRWGSKFAHSCSPNIFIRFEPSQNAMVFTVVRPLAVGDVISCSYLPEDDVTVGGLVCGTTIDRQARLEKFKFFTCACERCMDWDWSRGLACQACHTPVNYRDHQGTWTCFHCARRQEPFFMGDRENHVQRMVMGFAGRAYGQRRLDQAMEPYLLDLLEEVPKNHWTYSVMHALLATYHLSLFPRSFGKGLATQLGMMQKGLAEAVVYMEFLNSTIWSHVKSTAHGNPIAAFFAGWRILEIVIDLVMESTENKYANVTCDSDSEYDFVSDTDEEAAVEEEGAVGEEEAVTEPPTEPELIPLPQDWIAPVCKISDIVCKEWRPFIKQVFQSHPSPVVNDMLCQIKSFADRVEKTSPPPPPKLYSQ